MPLSTCGSASGSCQQASRRRFWRDLVLSAQPDVDLGKLSDVVARIGPTPEELRVPLTEDEFPKQTHTNAFRR